MLRTRAQRREPRDSIGNGVGGAKNHKKPQKSYRRDGENGRDSGGRIKSELVERECWSSRCRPSISREYYRKKTEREAQGTRDLNKNCRGSVSFVASDKMFLSRNIIDSPWRTMTRTTGPDCAVE